MKIIALILCSLLFIASCGSNEEGMGESYDVYIAGYSGGAAVLWKNGKPIMTLPEEGNEGYNFSSVFISGGTTYVAGVKYRRNKAIPVLWENGTPTYLSSGDSSTYARDVLVHKGDVYVVGNESSATYNAVLWKNGEQVELMDAKNAYAQGICVSGDDIYIVGQRNMKAVLWKNGDISYISDTYSDACSVFAYNNSILIGGYENGGGVTLWDNGEAFHYGDGRINSIYASHGYVCMAGNATIDGRGMSALWVNGELTKLDYYSDDANDVWVVGDSIYAVGRTNMKDEFGDIISVPVMWENYIPVTLSDKSGSANSIFIVKK